MMNLRDLREKIRLGLQPNGFFLRFNGAVHEDFSDKAFDFSAWRSWFHADPYATKTIVDQYLLAFFDRYLKGQTSVMLEAAHAPSAEAQFLNFSEHWVDWPAKGVPKLRASSN